MNWLKAIDFAEKHGIETATLYVKVHNHREQPFHKYVDGKLFIDEDYFISLHEEYEVTKDRAGDMYHLLTDKEGFDINISGLGDCFKGNRNKHTWISFFSLNTIFKAQRYSIINTHFSVMVIEFEKLARDKIMELIQDGQYYPTADWSVELCQEYVLERVA